MTSLTVAHPIGFSSTLLHSSEFAPMLTIVFAAWCTKNGSARNGWCHVLNPLFWMGSSLEFLLDSIFFFELVPKSTYYALMLAQTFLPSPFPFFPFPVSTFCMDRGHHLSNLRLSLTTTEPSKLWCIHWLTFNGDSPPYMSYKLVIGSFKDTWPWLLFSKR